MIQLLATGLGMSAVLVGVVLLAVWARRRLQGMRPGSLDPRCLEVVARVGLHANQGLAIVRVGQRHLLVSSGDGGARMLMEVEAEELVAPEVERPDFAAALREKRAARRMSGVRALPMLAIVGCLLLPATTVAHVSAQAPGPFTPSVTNPLQPSGPFDPDQVSPQRFGPRGPIEDGPFGPVFEALPGIDLRIGDEEGGIRMNGTVGTVIILGLLSLAPTLLLLTTSFTRILIVLHLLRQALGTQNTPPGHLLAGLALLLTTAVMAPTFDEMRVYAVDPWLDGQIEEGEMLVRAVEPLRRFMLVQTREADLATFLRVSQSPPPLGPDDISNTVLMSAFVTSELRAAFEIGFAIFLPFIVIDLVVAAVLTSMGMFMLPPTMIALPCKLMLFVLMDGWSLLLGALAASFV